jgi:MoaD family protein
MKVTIKLFGRYSEITGKKEFELDINNGDTIWDVITVLIKKNPLLVKDQNFIMVSRNNVYATFETKIKNGDLITISPPIVGGG